MSFDYNTFLECGIKFGGLRTSKFDVTIENEDGTLFSDKTFQFRAEKVEMSEYPNFYTGVIHLMEDEDMSGLAFVKSLVGANKFLSVNLYSKTGELLHKYRIFVEFNYYSFTSDWNATNEILKYKIYFHGEKIWQH